MVRYCFVIHSISKVQCLLNFQRLRFTLVIYLLKQNYNTAVSKKYRSRRPLSPFVDIQNKYRISLANSQADYIPITELIHWKSLASANINCQVVGMYCILQH